MLAKDRVRADTPPDPRTGATHVEMDVLEFIHRVTTQIPDARLHLVRYYGAYSHRSRGARRARAEAEAGAGQAKPDSVEPPPTPSRLSLALSRATLASTRQSLAPSRPLLAPSSSLVALNLDCGLTFAVEDSCVGRFA